MELEVPYSIRWTKERYGADNEIWTRTADLEGRSATITPYPHMVAGVGIEPTLLRLWASEDALPTSCDIDKFGLRSKTWTCDLLLPKQAFYQTELYGEKDGSVVWVRTRILGFRDRCPTN